MFENIALATVVSTLDHPPKNRPTCQKEEETLREKNIKLFMQRYEDNQDIWTGRPLSLAELQVRDAHSVRQAKSQSYMFAIYPYKCVDSWVFDDEDVGLTKEPFVGGTDVMIDRAIETFRINNANQGFALIFSNKKFKNFNIELDHSREGDGGNFYRWKHHNIEGWLCPALLKYFQEPPRKIYAQIKDAI